MQFAPPPASPVMHTALKGWPFSLNKMVCRPPLVYILHREAGRSAPQKSSAGRPAPTYCKGRLADHLKRTVQTAAPDIHTSKRGWPISLKELVSRPTLIYILHRKAGRSA